jgi:hypothetical protein
VCISVVVVLAESRYMTMGQRKQRLAFWGVERRLWTSDAVIVTHKKKKLRTAVVIPLAAEQLSPSQ